MLNLSKDGNTVYVLYGSKNYATGRTVVATILDDSDSEIGVSPLTLSGIASTGLYGGTFVANASSPPEEWKIKVTENSTDRAHASIRITEADIESVAGDVTSIKDVVENVTYGNSALKDKLDDIEGSGFATGSDSLKAIKDYLVNTIQDSISSISNNTRTAVAIPSQMLKPASGVADSPFKVYVNIYDMEGNMEDPDDQDAGSGIAMVSVNVVDEAGNDRTGNLADLDQSTQGSLDWMTRESAGRFSCTYNVSDTHDIEQLNFSFTYEESSVERKVDRSSVVTSQLDMSEVIDDIYSEVTNVTYGLNALKTLIDANQTDLTNIETKVDANQTDLTNIEAKIDTVDTVVDSNYTELTHGTYGLSALKTLVDALQTDLTAIKGSGFATGTDSLKQLSDRQQEFMGSGFSSGTDTLEEIRNAIDGLDTSSGGYIA